MSFEDRRFYVYVHRNRQTNEVFYVGKGTGDRCSRNSYRNAMWHQISNAHGYTWEIVKDDLLEDDALALESSLIKSGVYPNLVNVVVGASRVPLDKDEISKTFAYCESSPTGLIRTSKTFNGIGYVGRLGPAGKLCIKNGKSYYKIKYKSRSIHVHRLVWALAHGNPPTNMVIDHVDGNGLNNVLSNLRCVPQHVNCINRPNAKKGKDLPNGVYLTVRENRYRAKIRYGNKSDSKSFRFTEETKQQALQLAIEWRKEKEIEYGFNSNPASTITNAGL